MINKFIIFGKPLIGDEEKNEVLDSLNSGWIGTGPKVAQFEEDFKKYKGAEHAAAVSSCTAGLFLALKALDIGPGDEVITTAMTFVATVNSIVHTGATPILADINPISWNIDPNDIERKITKKTKAIMPVHFAGRMCDMETIMSIAKKYNLYVIEDCAHAIETERNGIKAGTIGDFGVFSFYATKNITTGEGGMVISNDSTKIDRIKRLALHGLSKDAWKRFSDNGYQHYYVEEPGYKYNMMDLQAAIGIHQLKKIEEFYIRRTEIWNTYLTELEEIYLELPAKFESNSKHALHLFNIQIRPNSKISRDTALGLFNNKKIGVGVHYLSILEHPYYKSTFKREDFPNAVNFGLSTISLPLSPALTNDELSYIISSTNEIMKSCI